MKTALGNVCVLLGLLQNALAQERHTFVPRLEFECGGAQVVIDSAPKGFRSPEEAYAKTGQLVQAQLVVVRGESRVAFQSWKDIDFIGGACVADSKGKPYIVYQAFCGGSGCDDRSNWGIIDATSLRELLKPTDHNTERAIEILGAQPPPVNRLVSLLAAK
jgi:hypothetical protein